MKPTAFRVMPDLKAMSQEAAEIFVKSVEDTLQKSKRFTVLLSGGRTPESLYKLLAASPDRERLDWKKIFFFWGDERLVPPTSQESNFRMVKAALLDHAPIPSENVFMVPTELESPEKVAAAYEKTIRDFFSMASGTPSFDFAFQGLGTDGHTASLFPDSDYAKLSASGDRLVVAPFVQHLKSHRISVTLQVLNATKQVLFLAAGADKAGVIKEIHEPKAGGPSYPAMQVVPKSEKLTWLIDAAAATNLSATANH